MMGDDFPGGHQVKHATVNHVKAFSSHYIKVIFKETACNYGQGTTKVFTKKDMGWLRFFKLLKNIPQLSNGNMINPSCTPELSSCP